jgi:replicative DNA helicase
MYHPISTPLVSNKGKRLTGHSDFDKCINGFNPGELILLTGKAGSLSYLMMNNLALKLAEERDVLILEHESSEQWFRGRAALYLDSSGHDAFPINQFSLHYESDLFFIEEIEKTIKRFTTKFENPVVFISPLQRLFLSKEKTQLSREEEMIRIIHNLKRIAVLYKVPVIVKSYIRSGNENHREPAWLNDLKEFENAQIGFDKKIFTHWPGYFVKGSSKSFKTGNELLQVTIAAGARNNLGFFELEFDYQKHKIFFENI